MTKKSMAGLVISLTFLPGCPGPPMEAAPECKKWIECRDSEFPEWGDQLSQRIYDDWPGFNPLLPDPNTGVCWSGDEETSVQCIEECEDQLVRAREMLDDEGREYGACAE